MARLGACLSKYWEQKKVMAGESSGCEPEHVTALIKALSPVVHGVSLCGAGGGGFMVAVTKDSVSRPNTVEMLKSVVEDCLVKSLGDHAAISPAFPLICPVRVDEEGMVLQVLQEIV